MAVNNSAGIFDWGPTGRSVEVDASGQLITTNEPVGGLYPLGYGKTGRALCVDGSGRLCITGVTTTSSGGSGSGAVDSAVATALSGRIYTGQDYELVEDLGELVYSVEDMNDRIFVGARANGNLYEMSASGWNKIAVVPDATRVNALKAWRGKLYVGALHDAEIYRLDGHNLTYITKASGAAGKINNFGEYDDKLIYVVEANYGTDANNRIYPVFYYDGSTSGILTKTRTNVPSWGWQFAPIALDHELYVYAPNEQYLHRFDGINYDFYGDSDLAGVIWSRVFKGRLYGFGTNGVITFDKSTKDNRVEFYSGNAMTAQTNSAIVYRGRMYACDSAGDIYQTDGTGEWTYDGTIGKSVAGLAIASGSLYVVALNGEVYKRTAALVESLDNDLDACSHQSRSKFAYDFYNASGVLGSKTLQNAYDNGDGVIEVASGSSKPMKVRTDYNENLFQLTKNGEGGGNVFDLTNKGVGDCMQLGQFGNGTALDINKTGTGAGTLIDLDNDGTGISLYINQDGNGHPIYIDSESTNKQAITVYTKQTSNPVMQFILEADSASSSEGIRIQNNQNYTGPCIRLENVGTGNDIQGYQWSITPSGRGRFRQINTPIDIISSGTFLVDWNIGQIKHITLGEGANNLTFSNPRDGAKYTLILHQDDIGSRTVNWPDSIKWRGGSAPTLTATASGIDIVSMIYSDSYSSYYADASLDFS